MYKVSFFYKTSGKNRIPKYNKLPIAPSPATPSAKNTGQQQQNDLDLRPRAPRIMDLAPRPAPRARCFQFSIPPRRLIKGYAKSLYGYAFQFIVSLLFIQ
jgi:hypothetical protein